jgi:[acyl-carrier-protein] S-malonyltransferase
LMEPAAEAMAEALDGVEIRKPVVPLVANVIAQSVQEPAEIRALLIEQVMGSVRWRESVSWMAGQGVTEMWEIGAGKALSGMIKRIDRSVATRAIGAPEDVAAAIAAMNE